MDTKRIILQGRGVVVRGNDIDTDRIIPARYLRTVTFEGLGEHAFEDDRKSGRDQGRLHPFDDERFRGAEILLVNANFGCGSSREHAPAALARAGIKAIVGESFAEIFFGNCVSLGIPCVRASAPELRELMAAVEEDPQRSVTVDLERQVVSVGSREIGVELPAGARSQFMEGRWDSTAELLTALEQVRATAAQLPYLTDFRVT